MVPVSFSFRGITFQRKIKSEALKRVKNLEKFYDGIMSCRIVIANPHRRGGRFFHVHVRVQTPQGWVDATREPEKDDSHRDLRFALHDTFDSVVRQLKKKSQQIKFLRRRKAARQKRNELPEDTYSEILRAS